MKKSEAAEIVMMLMSAFPNAKASESTSRVYESMLADLDASLVRSAITRLLATSKFLPSIAEIREAATAQQRGPRKTGAEAYEELLEAVQRHGGTPAVRWVKGEMRMQSPWPPLEPDVAAAMRQTWGSWSDCCRAPDAQEMADRARFIAAYDGLSERERADLVSGQRLPAPASSAARIEPRNNRAALAPVSSKGAAGSTADGASAAQPKAEGAAAPAGIPVPIAPWQRRVSAEELDAELARTGGAP